MIRHILMPLAVMVLGLAFSHPVMATEKTSAMPMHDSFGHDDFGGTYFTANSPDALNDSDANFSADMLNSIEPAAGGGAGFILPEDAADDAVRAMEGDRLEAPVEPLVPGME